MNRLKSLARVLLTTLLLFLYASSSLRVAYAQDAGAGGAAGAAAVNYKDAFDTEKAAKDLCLAKLSSTSTDYDALKAKCLKTDAPKQTATPAKTPVKQVKPAKPFCAYDATYEAKTNACVCSDVAVHTHWKGDQAGVIVRVQRKSVLQKIENNREVYACVATRDSVTALYDEMLRRLKAECNVQPTVDRLGPPSEESQKAYPPVIDDHDGATYDSQECATLKAYLDSLLSWRQQLEAAGPDKDGQPAPFTVANWLIVWNRTLQLADQVSEIATEIPKIKDRVLALENADHNRVDIDFEAGIRAGYYWRERTTDSGALGFDAMFTLWKGSYGAYVGGTGGWVKNPEQNRMLADMRLGFAYGGLCDMKNGEHPCVLRLGGAAHSEPILKYTNDVFGIAGALGFDYRPNGGLFSFGLELQVGGDRAAMYPPGRRTIMGTELYIAPTFFVGINPM